MKRFSCYISVLFQSCGHYNSIFKLQRETVAKSDARAFRSVFNTFSRVMIARPDVGCCDRTRQVPVLLRATRINRASAALILTQVKRRYEIKHLPLQTARSHPSQQTMSPSGNRRATVTQACDKQLASRSAGDDVMPNRL